MLELLGTDEDEGFKTSSFSGGASLSAFCRKNIWGAAEQGIGSTLKTKFELREQASHRRWGRSISSTTVRANRRDREVYWKDRSWLAIRRRFAGVA